MLNEHEGLATVSDDWFVVDTNGATGGMRPCACRLVCCFDEEA